MSNMYTKLGMTVSKEKFLELLNQLKASGCTNMLEGMQVGKQVGVDEDQAVYYLDWGEGYWIDDAPDTILVNQFMRNPANQCDFVRLGGNDWADIEHENHSGASSELWVERNILPDYGYKTLDREVWMAKDFGVPPQKTAPAESADKPKDCCVVIVLSNEKADELKRMLSYLGDIALLQSLNTEELTTDDKMIFSWKELTWDLNDPGVKLVDAFIRDPKNECEFVRRDCESNDIEHVNHSGDFIIDIKPNIVIEGNFIHTY